MTSIPVASAIPPHPTAAKPTQHRQSLDLARFVAAFGVVYGHAAHSAHDWVAHLSLSLFLVLTAVLAVQSLQRAGGKYGFLARAQRLILPWLFWSAVFRGVDLIVSDSPDKFQILTNPMTLLSGSSVHLWFLPFVAIAMVAVEPVGRFVSSPTRLAVALLGLLGLSLPLYWAHHTLALPEPVPQWLFAVPSYGIGLLLGLAVPLQRRLWPLALAFALSLCAVVISQAEPWAFSVFGSVLLFEVLWNTPMRHPVLPKLGQVSFGIYLVHPFFMLVVYKFLGGDVNPLLGAVLAFVMSWVAVMVLRVIPFFRRVT